jgi:hypothetical protein
MSSRLISVDELLEYSSGVDWATVAEDAGANDPRQWIESSNMIDRACAWAAAFCGQPQQGSAAGGLHATSQTEIGRSTRSPHPGCKVWTDRDGWLNFRTDTLPVLSVTASAWSYLNVPLAWSPIPAGNWWIEGTYPQRYHLIEASQDWTSVRQNPTLVSVSYVSGWFNAVLTVQVSAGAGVSLPVDSSLGAAVGDTVTIFDGAAYEQCTVSAVPDPTHVVVSSLAHAHEPGVPVSEVPYDVRHAVLLACTWAAKHPRGSEALEMRGAGGSVSSSGKAPDEEMAMAELLLEPFIRRV